MNTGITEISSLISKLTLAEGDPKFNNSLSENKANNIVLYLKLIQQLFLNFFYLSN